MDNLKTLIVRSRRSPNSSRLFLSKKFHAMEFQPDPGQPNSKRVIPASGPATFEAPVPIQTPNLSSALTGQNFNGRPLESSGCCCHRFEYCCCFKASEQCSTPPPVVEVCCVRRHLNLQAAERPILGVHKRDSIL